MFCPKCGHEMVPNGRFCTHCGADVQNMIQMPKENSPQSDLSLMEQPKIQVDKDNVQDQSGNKTESENQTSTVQEEESTKNGNILDVVGQNRAYYGAEFEKIDSGQKPRFNWAAFLLGPGLCFYRKCEELFKKYFLLGLILCFIGIIVETAGVTQFDFMLMAIGGVVIGIGEILMLINSIRFGIQFNRLYYNHCKSPIQGKSGVSMKNMVIYYVVVAGLSLLIFFAGTAIARQQYADIFGSDTSIDEPPGTVTPGTQESESTQVFPSETPIGSPSQNAIGLFDEFIGTWGDDSVDESFRPVAVGYIGDSKQQAYVKVSTAAALFITKLSLSDSNTAIGTIMSQDGEPGFEVTLHKNGTMLEATVYYGNIDLYFDNMDSYQHYNLTLVDPNNPDIDIDQPPMYPEPDLSSQEVNKYDQYNLYVYEGDFSDINESVHLLLSVQPNGVEFDCQLFWMHGKFLESGTVCPGVQTPLSGGTLITLDLETNGDIHVLLEGDGLGAGSYSWDMIRN